MCYLGYAEGKQTGSPVLKDNVNVKTNAVVVGRIVIGNDLLIAPNAFVNFDVPDLQSLLGILVK